MDGDDRGAKRVHMTPTASDIEAALAMYSTATNTDSTKQLSVIKKNCTRRGMFGVLVRGVLKQRQESGYQMTNQAGVSVHATRTVMTMLVLEARECDAQGVIHAAPWQGNNKRPATTTTTMATATDDASTTAPVLDDFAGYGSGPDSSASASSATFTLPPGENPKNVTPAKNVPYPIMNGKTLTVTFFQDVPAVRVGQVIDMVGVRYGLSVYLGKREEDRLKYNPVRMQFFATTVSDACIPLWEHMLTVPFDTRRVRSFHRNTVHSDAVKSIMGPYLLRDDNFEPADSVVLPIDQFLDGADVISRGSEFLIASVVTPARGFKFVRGKKKKDPNDDNKETIEYSMCVRDADGPEIEGSDIIVRVTQGFGGSLAHRVEMIHVLLSVYQVDILPWGLSVDEWKRFGTAIMTGCVADFVGSVSVDKTRDLVNMSAPQGDDGRVQANGSFLFDVVSTLRNTALEINRPFAESTLAMQRAYVKSTHTSGGGDGSGAPEVTTTTTMFVSKTFSTYMASAYQKNQRFFPLWLANGNAEPLFRAVDENKVALYALHAHDHDRDALLRIKAITNSSERMLAYHTWNKFCPPDKAATANATNNPSVVSLRIYAVALAPDINFETLLADSPIA